MRARALIPRRRRRDPMFCVGLAKSGTHSLVEMLDRACQAAHEPEFERLLELLPRVRSGDVPVGALRDFLHQRDARLNLDFEASHLLSSFTPHLLDAFPRARFMLLVRDCRAWVDSMINNQLNLRSYDAALSAQWAVVFDGYMLRGKGPPFAPEEEPLRELDLYPLASYVRFWRDEVRAVKAMVPPDQLLVLETREIAGAVDRLSDFVGVPARRIDLGRSHAFEAPRRHGVLDRLDPAFVEARLAEANVPPVEAHEA